MAENIKDANAVATRDEVATLESIIYILKLQIKRVESREACCRTCAFFSEQDILLDDGDCAGECTRYPPRALQLKRNLLHDYEVPLPENGYRTVTEGGCYCGEWQRGPNFGRIDDA